MERKLRKNPGPSSNGLRSISEEVVDETLPSKQTERQMRLLKLMLVILGTCLCCLFLMNSLLVKSVGTHGGSFRQIEDEKSAAAMPIVGSSMEAFERRRAPIQGEIDLEKSPSEDVDGENDINDHAHNIVNVTEGLVGYPRFFFGNNIVVEKDDISLVTHASSEKINRVVDLANRWNGPISCALYVPSIEKGQDLVKAYVKSHPILSEHVVWHLLAPTTYTKEYPINVMRNFALESALSDFVFPIDVDFIPSPSAYKELGTFLKSDEGRKSLLEKNVYVVPAFERHNSNGKAKIDDLPGTKADLIRALPSKLIEPFHSYFPPGHGPTDFTKWYTSAEPYSIQWKPRFEPYIIGFRDGLPKYWNGFVGYGYNKLSWIMELHYAGYQFRVLPNTFLIHINHEGRSERVSKEQMQKEYFNVFRPQLMQKYNLVTIDDPDWS